MPSNFSEELVVPVQEVETARTLEVMGLIVAASPNGEGDLVAIQNVFHEHGFGHLAPDMRSLKEALRVALVQTFSKKNRRVAPCGEGYEVTEEVQIPGTMRNESRHILSAAIKNDTIVMEHEVFAFDGGVYTISHLQQWVSSARQRIDGTILGKAIAAVCYELKGVSIRDGGGTYWLPSTSIDKFAAFNDAIDKIGRPVLIATLDMANTPRSVASTIMRIEALVESTCAELDAAVSDETLGVRAFTTKADMATKLIAQIAEYESVLSTALPTLQQKVRAAQRDVIQAGLDAESRRANKLAERRHAADQASADAGAAAAEELV